MTEGKLRREAAEAQHSARMPGEAKRQKHKIKKHIGEAAIWSKAIQGDGCKRSKNNMPEGREGETEK